MLKKKRILSAILTVILVFGSTNLTFASTKDTPTLPAGAKGYVNLLENVVLLDENGNVVPVTRGNFHENCDIEPNWSLSGWVKAPIGQHVSIANFSSPCSFKLTMKGQYLRGYIKDKEIINHYSGILEGYVEANCDLDFELKNTSATTIHLNSWYTYYYN